LNYLELRNKNVDYYHNSKIITFLATERRSIHLKAVMDKAFSSIGGMLKKIKGKIIYEKVF
jgi:hypothetical protein